MAQWVQFTRDYDHRWPSRAVTAFKKDQKVYVKDEVADRAFSRGAAKATDKPADSDPDHVTTRDPMESEGRTAYARADEPPATPSDTGPADSVAQRDDADDVGAIVRVSGDDAAGKSKRARDRS